MIAEQKRKNLSRRKRLKELISIINCGALAGQWVVISGRSLNFQLFFAVYNIIAPLLE